MVCWLYYIHMWILFQTFVRTAPRRGYAMLCHASAFSQHRQDESFRQSRQKEWPQPSPDLKFNIIPLLFPTVWMLTLDMNGTRIFILVHHNIIIIIILLCHVILHSYLKYKSHSYDSLLENLINIIILFYVDVSMLSMSIRSHDEFDVCSSSG